MKILPGIDCVGYVVTLGGRKYVVGHTEPTEEDSRKWLTLTLRKSE